MALKWNGQKVTAELRAAQVAGVNQTMAACVQHAKRHHPWQNRSGVLEGSIDIAEYAGPGKVGQPVRGLWGSRDVRYALIQELGGTVRPKKAKALVFKVGDRTVAAKSVTLPPRPYLRPAADVEYPKLANRIRRAFEKASGGQSGGAR